MTNEIDIAALIATRDKKAQETEAAATDATHRARIEAKQRVSNAQAKYEAELEADAKQRAADARIIALTATITESNRLLHHACLQLPLTTAQRAELFDMLKTTRDNYLTI
jgi:hypothetical protein